MKLTEQEKEIMKNIIQDYNSGVITIDEATNKVMPICDRLYIERISEMISKFSSINDVDDDMFTIKVDLE